MSKDKSTGLFGQIIQRLIKLAKKVGNILKKFIQSKAGKIILGAVLAVLTLTVVYGLIIDYRNSSRLNAYLNTKEFTEYSASMQAFLNANNGYYTKTYRCQASLQELWKPPAGTIVNKNESAEVQLARQLIDLDGKWRKVSNTYPGYIDSSLFKVLPLDHWVYKDYQNTANLMDLSSVLVEHTQDYGYYCPGHFYPKISSLSYLEDYSKAGTQITDSPEVITQRLTTFATMADKFVGSKTPVDWSENRQLYLAFLKQTYSDLKTLRAKRLTQPSVDMSAQFAADKKLLEQAVVAGQKAGLKIGPDIKQLKIYYEQTAN